jgi:hypothetical protein
MGSNSVPSTPLFDAFARFFALMPGFPLQIAQSMLLLHQTNYRKNIVQFQCSSVFLVTSTNTPGFLLAFPE